MKGPFEKTKKEGNGILEEERITALLFERSEEALSALSEKYGRICENVAKNILKNNEEAEETVSSALLAVWNSVPPKRPEHIGAYFIKTARNLALNRLEFLSAEKRGSGNAEVALSELEECIPSGTSVEQKIDESVFKTAVEDFLRNQPKEKRNIFILRYWYMYSVSEISEKYGIGESKVKSVLFRMRNELRKKLKKEDFI